jgi:hypothetical protein
MAYPPIVPSKELVPVFAKLFTIARLIEIEQVEEVAGRVYLDELKALLEGATRAVDVTKELIDQIQTGIPVDLSKPPVKDDSTEQLG